MALRIGEDQLGRPVRGEEVAEVDLGKPAVLEAQVARRVVMIRAVEVHGPDADDPVAALLGPGGTGGEGGKGEGGERNGAAAGHGLSDGGG